MPVLHGDARRGAHHARPGQRAGALGTLPAAEFTGRRLYEIMDLCLECKGCKAECPSNVDMAKLKYEFSTTTTRRTGCRPQQALRTHRASEPGCRADARLANRVNGSG